MTLFPAIPLPRSLEAAALAASPELARIAGAAPAATPEAAGDREEVLATRVGSRHLDLIRQADGAVEVRLDRPPIRNLVLSGGGAKGAAYPGAVAALEESGAMRDVQRIYGSSAGAITAALLASGMNSEKFADTTNSLDLMAQLDDPDAAFGTKLKRGLLSGATGALGAIAWLFGQDKPLQLARQLSQRLHSSADPLEATIRRESRQAVLAHLDRALAKAPGDPELAAIQERLTAGGGVTFADLRRLSRSIPEIKELQCTATMMVADRPQLAIFSADSTPDMDIGLAARVSGSFPVVFKQEEVAMPFGETHRFQDGGVLLNTPVPGLIDPPLDQPRIPNPDNLILNFQGAEVPPARKGSAVTELLVDGLFAGAPATAAGNWQYTRLARYADQTVEVPLRSERGDFSTMLNGTLNFAMPQDIKLHLQERLHDRVAQHLAERASTPVSARFGNLDQALLHLDQESFDDLAAADPGLTHAIADFRYRADAGVGNLVKAIRAVNAESDSLKLDDKRIAGALHGLDAASRGDPERQAYLARSLNRADSPELQQVLNAGRYQGSGKHAVLKAALQEYDSRDIRTIGQNLIGSIVYPARYRRGQGEDNLRLLQEVEDQLGAAGSRADINRGLERLIRGYRDGFDLLPGGPDAGDTVAQAKAALLPAIN